MDFYFDARRSREGEGVRESPLRMPTGNLQTSGLKPTTSNPQLPQWFNGGFSVTETTGLQVGWSRGSHVVLDHHGCLQTRREVMFWMDTGERAEDRVSFDCLVVRQVT